MSKPNVKKVILAYSGGLDTSIILKWLIDEYGCEVIAFAAEVGLGKELDGLEEKALKTGASKVYVADFDGPGDLLSNLGMLGGTDHCREGQSHYEV